MDILHLAKMTEAFRDYHSTHRSLEIAEANLKDATRLTQRARANFEQAQAMLLGLGVTF